MQTSEPTSVPGTEMHRFSESSPPIPYLSTVLPASKRYASDRGPSPRKAAGQSVPHPDSDARHPPAPSWEPLRPGFARNRNRRPSPPTPHPHHFLHGVRRGEKRKEELSELRAGALQALFKKGWGGVGWKRKRGGRKGKG